jgi:hypothetical protein
MTTGGCTARVVLASTREYPHAVALEPSWRPGVAVEALEENAARLAIHDAAETSKEAAEVAIIWQGQPRQPLWKSLRRQQWQVSPHAPPDNPVLTHRRQVSCRVPSATSLIGPLSPSHHIIIQLVIAPHLLDTISVSHSIRHATRLKFIAPLASDASSSLVI